MFNVTRFSLVNSLFIILLSGLFPDVATQDFYPEWQSHVQITQYGYRFQPNDYQAMFLFVIIIDSIIDCSRRCHQNGQCNIFNYDASSKLCHGFNGDINKLSPLLDYSLTSQSVVGWLDIAPNEFESYGQSCSSSCIKSRYMVCISGTCRCRSTWYFDGNTCQKQKVLGEFCKNNTECRLDMNYVCLPRGQCGPQSLQNGTTVAGNSDGVAGDALNALRHPFSINLINDNTLYVSDYLNHRIIKISLGNRTGSIVAGNGSAGNGLNQLWYPSATQIDNNSNLYIADNYNQRIMLWAPNSSSGVQITGTSVPGFSNNQGTSLPALILDSAKNMYISFQNKGQVMKWPVNGTFSVPVAGTGIPGNSSTQLDQPYGIFLDEDNMLLYVADKNNHRIQRVSLNGSVNATTVAGGNGAGPAANQLSSPHGVYVSKSGDIYVADHANHRIQLWRKGSSVGVTVVGSTSIAGSTAMLLNCPTFVLLSSNESHLYVADTSNNRVQRFTLI